MGSQKKEIKMKVCKSLLWHSKRGPETIFVAVLFVSLHSNITVKIWVFWSVPSTKSTTPFLRLRCEKKPRKILRNFN